MKKNLYWAAAVAAVILGLGSFVPQTARAAQDEPVVMWPGSCFSCHV
jgi:hypothetical protein